MPETMRVLCVHGVGNHRDDLDWQSQWREVIERGVRTWDPQRQVELDFIMYDDIFAQHPISVAATASALAQLMMSGVVHGITDIFRTRGARGLFDIPERLRWTAGMVVQWVENETLRTETRSRMIEHVGAFDPHVILAHSLGSLVAYDSFIRDDGPAWIAGRHFASFGSQIGNPFVRASFGGRIVPLDALRWFHLYNRHDDVFAASVRVRADNFEQVLTTFDLSGFGDHDATAYLGHRDTVNALWGTVIGGRRHRALARTEPGFARAVARPMRRALLVGINEYPNETDRLEGCVNDVFRMSEALQECGYEAEEIRVVLDDRATADGIRERLHWLLDNVDAGDERVFYYSGHGAQIPGYGAGETIDHVDECLVAHDFDWSRERAIVDDDLLEFYSQLPYDARFVIMLDCCHSGGMTRQGGLRVRGIEAPDDVRHRALRWNTRHQMWEARELAQANRSITQQKDSVEWVGSSGARLRLGRSIPLRTLPNGEYDAVRKELGHHGPYLPLIYQACQEHEYAYEYRHGATSYGAFTYAMTQTLRKRAMTGKGSLTFEALLKAVTKVIHDLEYDQTPALVGPRHLRRAEVPWGR